ncbi:MAG: hypothetical protein WAL37_04085, partial [Xanthobacteraceae bacterium]
MRRYRRRRQHGIYRRPIDVTDAQLDALEERGYLDPDRRGDRADDALEERGYLDPDRRGDRADDALEERGYL